MARTHLQPASVHPVVERAPVAFRRVGHGRVSDRLPDACASAEGAAAHARVADRGAAFCSPRGVAMLPASHDVRLPLVAIAAGVAGAAITLLKCAAYARRSDIEGLPSSSSLWRGDEPAHLSRDDRVAAHRAAVRARVRHLRGLLRPAATIVDTAASPTASRCPAAPPSTPRRVAAARQVLSPPFLERSLDERRRAADPNRRSLARSTRRARHSGRRRVACRIATSASRSARGRWAHVQALVEDHGAGRCLFRTRATAPATTLRLSHWPSLAGVVTVVGRSSTAVVSLRRSLALTRARADGTDRGDVARGARQIIDVLAGVARDHGMQEMAAEALDAGPAAASSWRRLSATHGS